MTPARGWIGVDLDGTLAHYDEWHGETHIGEPVPLMVERVKRWHAEGREIRIFTARVYDGDGRNVLHVRQAIVAWCLKHIGVAFRITNVKDYDMIELWDDRAVAVDANTGKMLSPSRRGLK